MEIVHVVTADQLAEVRCAFRGILDVVWFHTCSRISPANWRTCPAAMCSGGRLALALVEDNRGMRRATASG